MSFAHRIKSEICSNRPFRQRRQRAMACGLLSFGGRFDRDAISIHTEHRKVARLYADSITDLVGISGSITVQEIRRGDRRLTVLPIGPRCFWHLGGMPTWRSGRFRILLTRYRHF